MKIPEWTIENIYALEDYKLKIDFMILLMELEKFSTANPFSKKKFMLP